MRKVRFLNLAVTLGLVVGLFAAAIGSASADPSTPGQSTIYFPWVANGYTPADGNGPWFSTVTVQNTEIYPITVDVFKADGSTLAGGVLLNPRASKTWTAASLGVPAPGAGVYATAKAVDQVCADRTYSVDNDQGLWTNTVGTGFNGKTDTVVSVTADAYNQLSPTTPPTVVTTATPGFEFTEGTDYTVEFDDNGDLRITWLSSGKFAIGGTDAYEVTVERCVNPSPRIAGVEKHATPALGGNARTNASTVSVDGYAAVSNFDAALSNTGGWTLNGQSRWIQPIAQTRDGWNTILFVTNVSDSDNVGVNAHFNVESGQGWAGPSVDILNTLLAKGETATVDLTADAGFPATAVGSIWVDADAQVVAQVYRLKAETGMALTNVAQPRNDGDFSDVVDFPLPFSADTKYAPLVFRDYNGWNTGLNIANLSSFNNQVTITYVNYAGNTVAVDSKNIPAEAMEVVYRPAKTNSPDAESQITAAIIKGTGAFAAAVDEVKYLSGTDQGQAMSYLAQWGTQAGNSFAGSVFNPIVPGRIAYSSLLALPLVQQANMGGNGDISGINLFNPVRTTGVDAYVQIQDSAGTPVAPSRTAGNAEAPVVVEVLAGGGTTVYMPNFSELNAGFTGSAIVGAVDPAGRDRNVGLLVGVSNNVNYDVEFDGSAVYNMAALDWRTLDPSMWDFFTGFGLPLGGQP